MLIQTDNNKQKNQSGNNNSNNIPKNQKEFGHKKRIKP